MIQDAKHEIADDDTESLLRLRRRIYLHAHPQDALGLSSLSFISRSLLSCERYRGRVGHVMFVNKLSRFWSNWRLSSCNMWSPFQAKKTQKKKKIESERKRERHLWPRPLVGLDLLHIIKRRRTVLLFLNRYFAWNIAATNGPFPNGTTVAGDSASTINFFPLKKKGLNRRLVRKCLNRDAGF